ncbi:hypothetical protein DPMN_038817 [Dreissena polymorpha]|uniref:Uncharacterized protein n=1 Tax=Dreissena polymorpha TaxID=45954 RepID=A0A9D4RP12_DREPO|nr:hypothetical protein DPMN_038817 [Dreissena polymorpha]
MAEGGARRDEPGGFPRQDRTCNQQALMAEGGARRDEPGGFPRQDRTCNQQALWDNASVETCTVMTWLGYGPEIRQARRDAYMEYCRHCTARLRGAATCIITGSKAEGLTSFLESDRDQML